jgi:hypothetical protein
MSEPKLCPYRDVMLWTPETDGKSYNTYHTFGPCLQDKCAMWREKIKEIHTNPDSTETVEYYKYCGLAGKPYIDDARRDIQELRTLMYHNHKDPNQERLYRLIDAIRTA